MGKVRYECLYCSNSWEKTYYYLTDYETEVKCPKCNDSSIKKLKFDEESRDYFGYNVDFLKKKKIVKKEEK